jgi:hypothetical protein
VEGYILSYKREGYWFIAHLVGNPSCRIDINGDTERYPVAGGHIRCRYSGKGRSKEFRTLEKVYVLALEDHGMVMKENETTVPSSALAERVLKPFFELMH